MGKRIYISGNTINGFDDFTLTCTKDFENKFFTSDSSLVDDEEYFYAEFKSVEAIESCYENKIIKLQDEILDLKRKLKASESLLNKYCFTRFEELDDLLKSSLNQVAQLSQIKVNLERDISKKNGEILELKQEIKYKNQNMEEDNAN